MNSNELGDPHLLNLLANVTSDAGEAFMSLDESDKQLRPLLISCMPLVHYWNEAARNDFKATIQKTFFKDKAFFKELLTNGDNDCSPLLFADVAVQTDEEILFLAMKADRAFGNIASAFSIFASEIQKNDPDLIDRLLKEFPESRDFL